MSTIMSKHRWPDTLDVAQHFARKKHVLMVLILGVAFYIIEVLHVMQKKPISGTTSMQ